MVHDVLQPVVEGIRAKQLPEPVACMGLEILHFVRHDQANAFRLQPRVDGSKGSTPEKSTSSTAAASKQIQRRGGDALLASNQTSSENCWAFA